MKILIAPDSFKGSLSALEFCAIVSKQIQSLQPDTDICVMPLADGGEGTIDAVVTRSPAKVFTVRVHNPLGKLVHARYAILEEQQTAVIEMAQASGLPLLAANELDPMTASSYGTGELILHALDQGCRQFIIGLGGSATNDGGTGMLQALGVNFLDRQQQNLQSCGQALKDIETIDLSGFDPRIQQSEIIIASDVTNPLCGENGATYIYGPQKGAEGKMLAQLDAGMRHFANKTSCLFNSDNALVTTPGTGAAGGMGFALMAYCQATMKSGFELLAEMAGLDEILASGDRKPDLIITGEGRFDSQSLQGKLVGRLSERADKYKIPLLVICGTIGDDLNRNEISRNISVYSLCHSPSKSSSKSSSSLDYAIKNSAVLLKQLISNLVKVLFIDHNKD